MPFIRRYIEPKHVSRVSLFNEDGTPKIQDGELEAIANGTLCNALRQLASLSVVADDIFKELGEELKGIHRRGENLKSRIKQVEEKVRRYDPKKIPVPEGDLTAFSTLSTHYKRARPFETNLFDAKTRPDSIKALYEAAAKTPVHAMRHLDRWRRDGCRSSRFFLCTPVLGEKRRKLREKVDIDIETSVPASIEELRRWTSDEALGDVTVTPDCTSRITNVILTDVDATDNTITSDDEGIDHKLPSPEEQLHVVALKFPSEIVTIDISGRSFDRMSAVRRSARASTTVNCQEATESETVKRRTRQRRPRSRRRNTLAGTDQKEIREALTAGEDTTSASSSKETDHKSTTTTIFSRSKSSDILRSTSKKESPDIKKPSHFNTLKQWGKTRYDKFMNKSTEKDSKPTSDIDDFNVYETVTIKRKRDLDKERKTHERNSSISSSEKSGVNINPPSTNALSSVMNIAVKLRDSSVQRRQRRANLNKDEPHSSSGNWSASSESGRASIGSEITSTTHPKSTTTTSCNSLNVPPSSVNSRRKFNVNMSTSSSVTSEGTLTPDIIHDLHEDGETSSVYSCDTEGYYTSFHMDSGLKTLKEEDTPPTPLHSTSAFSNSGSNNTVLSAENEYELFGKGSTSTTTSSAGTVCTTLRASESNRSLIIGPAVPERKSSLNGKSPQSSLERDEKTGTVKRSPNLHKPSIVGVIKKSENGDVSPDSGNNTSSSPIESVCSPNRNISDFDISESSDVEGVERIERIRVKTAINSSRIPSMCVITPINSDDDMSITSASSFKFKKYSLDLNLQKNEINENENDILKSSDSDKENLNINTHIINNRDNTISLINVNKESGYCTVEKLHETSKKTNFRAASPSGGCVIIKDEKPISKTPIIKTTLLPLNNIFDKLKNNITNLTSTQKTNVKPDETEIDSGEYVTIADIKNNNDKIKESEYISLSDLPNNNSLERNKRIGARVTLDAEGKVVYTSDSLKRKKNSHSTFEPGPCIKNVQSPTLQHRTIKKTIRPVLNDSKIVVKASGNLEIVRKPPTTVVCANISSPKLTASRGAYVNMRNASNGGNASISAEEKDQEHSRGNQPQFQYPNSTPGQHQHQETYRNDYLQKYSTMPVRKTHYFSHDIQTERSVTPDITRGLERHTYYDETNRIYNSNRYIGIPVRIPEISQNEFKQSCSQDSFKISPIDPIRNSGGFKSSTPSRNDLKAATNLENMLLSPKKSTMSNDELYAVIHKNKKKMNIVDEVKVLPVENKSPIFKNKQPESGYLDKSKTRLSWSPTKGEYIDFTNDIDSESRSRQSWACNDRKGPQKTSTLDFKRLLLQKSSLPNSGKKLSAVEQLKLSKTQIQSKNQSTDNNVTILDLTSSPRSFNRRAINAPGSPERQNKSPSSKILSPKSQWRFNSPRSDVLSSTILEDCREDDSNSSGEKKISPKVLERTKRYQSVAERLQASRAEFFGQSSANKSEIVKPTLETAF